MNKIYTFKHSPKIERLKTNFFSRIEVEQLRFIFGNNGCFISQYQQSQYDSVSKLKTNNCEAQQPQYQIKIEQSEMNWLYFLKLEPQDTFLRNTTIAALFVSVFG